MPQTEDAKHDMLNKCSDYYRTNQVELKKIELFRNSYTSDKAIEWDTCDSFVYRLLNKVLRTENIDLRYLFRFYIIDLCSQLEQESKRKAIDTETFTLYRGQQISTEEFNQLKANVGVLISINAHPNLENTIFADVDKCGRIQGEQEVLSSIGAVFKTDNVQLDPHLRLWKIGMTATDDGSKNLQEYINSIKQEIDDISPSILFGALLFNEMGQIDKAEKYFNMLLKALPIDHPDVPNVYDQIANIFAEQGKLNMALENYTYAYEIRRLRFFSDDIHIANSLHNLGFIHKQKGEYDKAMDYYRKVLAIDEKNYPNDHANKAHTMICI
ncbi:unnamed protein product, partial [Rotaria sordida]